MAASLDLDINNYSIHDLIVFFKLPPTYTSKELNDNEKAMTLAVLKTKDVDENKYNLLSFIQKGKETLMDNLNPETVNSKKDKPIIKQKIKEPEPEERKTEEPAGRKANNIGRIINPFYNRPSLQQQSIPYNSVNGYGYNTFIVNYVFNTQFRDDFFNSQSTNCTFTFPMKMKNVISLSLSGIQFPNVMFTFSALKGTNRIFIRLANPLPGYDIKEALVTIPDGNYSSVSDVVDPSGNPMNFQTTLAYNLNKTFADQSSTYFTVTIDPNSLYLTISCSVVDFEMYTITDPYGQPYGQYYECETDFTSNFKVGDADPKLKISPETYISTMGYQMGFRKTKYSGSSEYITESHFDPTYSDYVYFTLNDYAGSQSSNVYGILPNSTLDKNILAVIPITTPQNTNTFDNNSNFIYKTRNYIGPVDIGKITIGLINPTGGQLDLHYTDFAFMLQVQSIYDNNIPYQNNTVSII